MDRTARFMTKANEYNLPVLEGTFDVARDEYIEISINSETLAYSIHWPSGYFKKGLSTEQLHDELKRVVTDGERREQVIRYATDKRRTALFPNHGRKGQGIQYIMFPGPDNRIYFGGGGNSGGLRNANPFALIDIDSIKPDEGEPY